MIDEVSLKIIWDRLVSLVNEASRVLYRSAFSTLVRECNDFACSLLTTSGDTLAIADNALPSFATTQSITLRACLELFPLDTWRPGDVVITNDPWIGTGQIMDLTILKPVFRKGSLVAFTGSVAHNPDLGGVQRWNGAVDVFEEGMYIRPTFLFRDGVRDDTLFELIGSNSRRPDQTLGDLMAQLSSNDTAERRLLEIMEEHDLDTLREAEDLILGRTEQAMRNAIEAVPDGEYSFAMQADSFRAPLERLDGNQPAPSLDVVTRIRVRGSSIEVDYGESSSQVEAAINSIYPFTFAYTAYTLRLLLVPHVPQNSGSVRPLNVIAPTGTIFNAAFPAPSLNRSIVGHLVCDGIFGALSDVLPDRVWAMGGSTPIWLLILIGKEESGRDYQRIIPINGGLGANEGSDGEICSFPANLSNAEIEILESSTPIICDCKELIPDSAGAGRFRGGFGVRFVVRPLSRTVYSIAFNRVNHPPQGMLGGANGRRGRVLLNDRELEPGAEGVLETGDVLVLEAPGGGGIGLPSERERSRVDHDIDEGLLTRDAAERAYDLPRAGAGPR